MNEIISELQITPIKPANGLVAFASFVLYESIYCCSVGIVTRPDGSYRLVYPTKKVGTADLHIFHPINRSVGKKIEIEVIAKAEEVLGYETDR